MGFVTPRTYASPQDAVAYLQKFIHDEGWHESWIEMFREFGWLDDEGQLTMAGIKKYYEGWEGESAVT